MFRIKILFFINFIGLLFSDNYIVKINQPNGYGLNIAEVELFKLSQKLNSSLLTFTSSPIDQSFNASSANDGNYYNFFSSSVSDPYLEITTDINNSFDKIIVTNRRDCCQFRIINAYIKLYSSADLFNVYIQINYRLQIN